MAWSLATRFAPAERADADVLAAEETFLDSMLGEDPLLDSVSEVLAILNEQRQVVYCNRRLLELLETTLGDVLGRRPGEALGCIHSDESPGGCGTTESCRQCGAVRAILKAQAGQQAVKECRILTHGGSALDLRVWATPMEAEGRTFTVFAAADISHEKRREALERVFFHDILNTAGNVQTAAELLRTREVGDPGPILEIIEKASSQLVDEIHSHRLLLSAEGGTLEASSESLSSLNVLERVRLQYEASDLARSRTLRVAPGPASLNFRSDPTLLARVLGNLTKNALEATEKGGVVTLGCREEEDAVVFSVNNPAVMERSTQLQIFQRSFSTKGAGRGIGTYSVKLLTEQYLGGQVWFESEEPEGTTFHVRLPQRPD